MTLFEKIGGRDTLIRISKRFYDKIYKHPWLSLYFKNTKQSIIEAQQVDFMTGALGGPKIYGGRTPVDAHTHLNITNELYELRKQLLTDTLKEENAPSELIDRWFKIEDAFKNHIIKKDISECTKRWVSDEILDFSKQDPIRKVS